MSPDLLRNARQALAEYESLLADNGMPETAARAREIGALLAALPPDPGGEMPEPMCGQVVDWFIDTSRIRWRRSVVGPCHPPEPDPDLGPGPWRVVLDAGTIIAASVAWTPATIREIRTPDGRVLWRAA